MRNKILLYSFILLIAFTSLASAQVSNGYFSTGNLTSWTVYRSYAWGSATVDDNKLEGLDNTAVLFTYGSWADEGGSFSNYCTISQSTSFTGYNSLKFRGRTTTTGSSVAGYVYIDSILVQTLTTTDTEYTIDVSGYSGTHTIQFMSWAFGESSIQRVYIDNIRLSSATASESTISFNADSYTSGSTANVSYDISDSDWNPSNTYFVDCHYYNSTDGSWNLADREYINYGGSGSQSGTKTISLPVVSANTNIRAVLQYYYLPTDSPEGIAIDTAIVTPSSGGGSGNGTTPATINWQSSEYQVSDTATAIYSYAPSGSYARLLNTNTMVLVGTWTGLSSSGSLTYTIPSTAYGNTYLVALYNSSNSIIASDSFTVKDVVDGGLGVEWTLSGKVYNAETGAVVSGATISDSDGEASATSSSIGHYSLSLKQGLHRVTCSISGYESRQLDLYFDQHSTYNWYLSPANPSTTTTDTLYGTVLSLNTGLPVQNAAVSAGGKTVFTSSTGYYELALSSSGSYTVTVSKTNYDTISEIVAVSGETNRDFLLVPVEYDGGTTTTPPGGGTTSPTDDDGGGQDGTGDSGDESSDTTSDSDEDGVPDNVDDSDGDGIVDAGDDSPYGRSDRIAAQNTMNKLSTQIPTLIELVILMVVFSLFGIKFGK